ncbi:gibberellin 20-oxidase-like protein, partial [Dioscorea cayenensis subsp. rotundata]|uniref:Gibberellin 20-oxidase-like protein n=1 Tax=Dioscorea cayennensis subsp. rotundata TaxID=55577 RepID=A0AB40C7Q8_DIOCR
LKTMQETLQLPQLDISLPLLSSSLQSLSHACKEWGFFLITNHGISKELHQRLHSLCNEVFSLPLDIKLKLGPFSSIRTYTPCFIASPFFESLRVSGPNYLASAKSSIDVLFDLSNTELCNALEEYGAKMMELSKRIMVVLLKCLGDDFDTKYYEKEFSKCHGYMRVNNYCPPDNMINSNNNVEDHVVEGLGMHTDMSCITILYQDEIGGLQVKSRGGQWMDIVPNEGTLVVNIGDMLQAWSNGQLRSSEHRVVLRKPVNRFSLAFFWCFEDEKVILAPEDVVEEGKQRIYQPFKCFDYVKFRENNEKGKFEKVGYTVDDFAACKTPKLEQ